MTVRILARGLALLFLILPGVSLPLGLGEITVETHLNQPLRAEIKMVSVRPQDVEYVRISLAPIEAFDRAGISRPYVLNQLEFTPTVKNGEQAVISVTSKRPIREPFLNFLVEVVWPKGRLMREYTILLDPPVFADQQRSVVTKVPSLGASSDTVSDRNVGSGQTSSKRVVPYSAPLTTQAQQKPGSGAERVGDRTEPTLANNRTYETQRGDTLSKIVRELMSNDGFSLQQKMIAMLRANPEAFVGNNINNLKTNKLLQLPDQAELELVSREEARAEVTRQYTQWRETRAKLSTDASPKPAVPVAENKPKLTGASDSNLEILASDKADLQQGSVVASENTEVAEIQKQLALMRELAESRQQENEELSSRSRELEEIIAQQDRLIKLQSEEIANLQQLGSEQVEAGSRDLPSEASPSTESPSRPVEQTELSKGQSAKVTAEDAVRGDSDRTLPEEQPKVSPPAPVTGSLLDDLVGNPLLPLGLAVLGVLLAGLAWWVVRGSKKAKQEVVAEFEERDIQQVKVPGQPAESDQSVRAFEEELPTSQFGTEKTRSDEEIRSIEGESQTVEPEDSDLAAESSQKDVLTDADVYIAYGMHEEAEQRLKEAIAQHPDNAEYNVKLLEVYHGAGNQQAFDAMAQTLHHTKFTNAAIWERVLSMGRAISPDNPLYSEGEPELPAQLDEETELESNDEDLKHSIDEFITNLAPEQDLDEETTPITEEDEQLIDVSPESEGPSEQTEDLLDFDIDSLDFETKPGTAQDTGLDAQRLEVSSDELLDFELSDLEADARKEERAPSDLDIGSVDDKTDWDASASDAEMASPGERPTEILDASLIDKKIFEELVDHGVELSDDKPDVAAIDTEVGSRLIGESGSGNDYQPAIEGLADKTTDIESILEGLQDDQATESKRLTEEIETTDRDTAILPPEDEVNTKLDLARAYIDMGDSDGARSTLEEVLEEGDSEQCKEAQELLKLIA